jgi:demethylmenaquinone methyltransferase/2-methoxy-6-polyprenyl-1,4-benzoquinol methylase
MLEFFEPRATVPRLAWEAYVRAGLPVLGRLASPAWGEVGSFLGPSIRDFWEATPPDKLKAIWNEAGIGEVDARLLSLGGGIVMWGRRGN